MLQMIWTTLTSEGGFFRVRAALALGLTGFGGAYVLLNETMPPEAFTVIWTGAVAYYFGTRGAAGGR